MESERSIFNIPSFAREEVYSFPTNEDQMVFAELSQISDEVLRCRQENFRI